MSSSVMGDTVSTQLSTKSDESIETTESGRQKSAPKMATTWREMFRIWPYHSFLIIIMEFSFSLTALNNVFNLYYINVLGFDPDTTVIILNIKGIIGGFCRLFGSCISDSYLGKFRAIFYGSCVFIVGKLILTAATFLPPGLPHPWLDFTAALIIMVGVSAMGPSITPFAGDQFEPHQEKMISVYYSIFYATINIGAMISNVVMPILRARPCFGKDSCYPLSFGVSTIGVITAFMFFIIGSKWYVKSPPKGNIFSAVYNVVKTAKANKKNSTRFSNMSPPAKCVCCSEEFSNIDELEAHISADHYNCLPFDCEKCKFGKFPTEFAIKRHYEEDHGLVDYFIRYRVNDDIFKKRQKVRECLEHSIRHSGGRYPNRATHDGKLLSPSKIRATIVQPSSQRLRSQQKHQQKRLKNDDEEEEEHVGAEFGTSANNELDAMEKPTMNMLVSGNSSSNNEDGVIMSQRGKPKLIHGGYLYNFEKFNREGTMKFWRCQFFNKKCRARLHTTADDKVIKEMKEHDCPTDPENLEAKRFVTALKRRAADTLEPLEVLRASIIDSAPPTILAKLPSEEAMKKIVQRVRHGQYGGYGAIQGSKLEKDDQLGPSTTYQLVYEGDEVEVDQLGETTY